MFLKLRKIAWAIEIQELEITASHPVLCRSSVWFFKQTQRDKVGNLTWDSHDPHSVITATQIKDPLTT